MYFASSETGGGNIRNNVYQRHYHQCANCQ